MCVALFYSVVIGVGEMDLGKPESTSPLRSVAPPAPSVCPYLLLDVRDKEDYDRCHIVTGE